VKGLDADPQKGMKRQERLSLGKIHHQGLPAIIRVREEELGLKS
jgi:hypothetical protein